VYAIIYATLEKTKLFGENRKELNSMIAFIISLLFVGAANVVGIMTEFLPYVGLLSVLVVCYLMITSLIFGEFDQLLEQPYIKHALLGVATFAFIFTFGFVVGWWDMSMIGTGEGVLSGENLSVMLFFLILLGLIFVITGVPKLKRSKGGNE